MDPQREPRATATEPAPRWLEQAFAHFWYVIALIIGLVGISLFLANPGQNAVGLLSGIMFLAFGAAGFLPERFQLLAFPILFMIGAAYGLHFDETALPYGDPIPREKYPLFFWLVELLYFGLAIASAYWVGRRARGRHIAQAIDAPGLETSRKEVPEGGSDDPRKNNHRLPGRSARQRSHDAALGQSIRDE